MTQLTPTITLLRIKRKRNEDPIDALLVADRSKDKKIKAMSGAKVFKLIDSVDTTGFDMDAIESQPPLRDALAKLATQQRDMPKRRASSYIPTEVFSSTKLQAAQASRFQIVENARHAYADRGVHVVDIAMADTACDPRDEITCNLMPMVREYLSITEPDYPFVNVNAEGVVKDQQNQKQHVQGDVYDFYYYDEAMRVGLALQSNRVGTIDMDEHQMAEIFLGSDDGSSDDTESEDSNAEDYFANDYPEEEDYEQSEDESDSDSDRRYQPSELSSNNDNCYY